MLQIDLNPFLNLLVVLGQILVAFLAWRAKVAAEQTKLIAEKTEINTNSMRERLVETTAKAEFARGLKDGKEEAKL